MNLDSFISILNQSSESRPSCVQLLSKVWSTPPNAPFDRYRHPVTLLFSSVYGLILYHKLPLHVFLAQFPPPLSSVPLSVIIIQSIQEQIPLCHVFLRICQLLLTIIPSNTTSEYIGYANMQQCIDHYLPRCFAILFSTHSEISKTVSLYQHYVTRIAESPRKDTILPKLALFSRKSPLMDDFFKRTIQNFDILHMFKVGQLNHIDNSQRKTHDTTSNRWKKGSYNNSNRSNREKRFKKPKKQSNSSQHSQFRRLEPNQSDTEYLNKVFSQITAWIGQSSSSLLKFTNPNPSISPSNQLPNSSFLDLEPTTRHRRYLLYQELPQQFPTIKLQRIIDPMDPKTRWLRVTSDPLASLQSSSHSTFSGHQSTIYAWPFCHNLEEFFQGNPFPLYSLLNGSFSQKVDISAIFSETHSVPAVFMTFCAWLAIHAVLPSHSRPLKTFQSWATEALKKSFSGGLLSKNEFNSVPFSTFAYWHLVWNFAITPNSTNMVLSSDSKNKPPHLNHDSTMLGENKHPSDVSLQSTFNPQPLSLSTSSNQALTLCRSINGRKKSPFSHDSLGNSDITIPNQAEPTDHSSLPPYSSSQQHGLSTPTGLLSSTPLFYSKKRHLNSQAVPPMSSILLQLSDLRLNSIDSKEHQERGHPADLPNPWNLITSNHFPYFYCLPVSSLTDWSCFHSSASLIFPHVEGLLPVIFAILQRNLNPPALSYPIWRILMKISNISFFDSSNSLALCNPRVFHRNKLLSQWFYPVFQHATIKSLPEWQTTCTIIQNLSKSSNPLVHSALKKAENDFSLLYFSKNIGFDEFTDLVFRQCYHLGLKSKQARVHPFQIFVLNCEFFLAPQYSEFVPKAFDLLCSLTTDCIMSSSELQISPKAIEFQKTLESIPLMKSQISWFVHCCSIFVFISHPLASCYLVSTILPVFLAASVVATESYVPAQFGFPGISVFGKYTNTILSHPKASHVFYMVFSLYMVMFNAESVVNILPNSEAESIPQHSTGSSPAPIHSIGTEALIALQSAYPNLKLRRKFPLIPLLSHCLEITQGTELRPSFSTRVFLAYFSKVISYLLQEKISPRFAQDIQNMLVWIRFQPVVQMILSESSSSGSNSSLYMLFRKIIQTCLHNDPLLHVS